MSEFGIHNPICPPQLDWRVLPFWREDRSCVRHVLFYCPACKDVHDVPLAGGGRPGATWTWNNDVAKPTITPSVNYSSRICHFHITAGKILYQNDCTHAMKGQTVALPQLNDWPLGSLVYWANELAVKRAEKRPDAHGPLPDDGGGA